ncbi:hypothetical protein GCK72_007138 [Caenorhabditis remanei]|uniref:NR LBD domain-containing protein n=1 Tax=Caenorhabditis remanei TaxID=31234 RepID=A0A6A5HIC9_CAERE|nr:hypothetical protein GCK72_007138 [Caenorhabditis remanei]KAF1767179.1 hypothetical protein GCK72_007138 [Caenorhabditis remanei]
MEVVRNADSSQPTSSTTGISKTLKMSYPEVLMFYVGQTKRAMDRRLQGSSSTSPQDALEQFLLTKKLTDQIAMELCLVCPGTDLLERSDLDLMFQHCSFVSIWLDSALMSVSNYEAEEKKSGREKTKDEFLRFNRHFQSTVTSGLARLKPDLYEYSALKAFCIWKLGLLDSSPAMKAVANEHYLAVTSALAHYYQSTKNLEQFEIASRIADITLLLGPMFSVYQDVSQLYSNLNIKDCIE